MYPRSNQTPRPDASGGSPLTRKLVHPRENYRGGCGKKKNLYKVGKSRFQAVPCSLARQSRWDSPVALSSVKRSNPLGRVCNTGRVIITAITTKKAGRDGWIACLYCKVPRGSSGESGERFGFRVLVEISVFLAGPTSATRSDHMNGAPVDGSTAARKVHLPVGQTVENPP